jgi:hypothetical protein
MIIDFGISIGAQIRLRNRLSRSVCFAGKTLKFVESEEGVGVSLLIAKEG